MTTTTIRTGSTRASRPVGLRKRVSARAVVPTLAGIAIAALAVTATVQLGAPNDGESGVLAVASVDELTAAGAQGYAVSLVSAVDDTQASDARTSDIASIVVTTPTPTPTPEPEPAPAPKAPSPESSSSGGSSYEEANVSSDPSIDATLARIAQCESGGNPAAVNPAGYYGLYQFSIPTWQSVGGTGLPSEASVAEQTMRAKMLQAKAGWGQWSCY
ncbi:transglycosylase family protein [Pseudoclavibacter helvolus]|uniref:Soluble lytic murein transglycosylase-like protein n=1 Tax=Pseudoclavibacter helvolus TaxID=255205 RepID=A0A7W4YEN1_9MICO|nr:transglycosylase family protein [Pseudoclavibacter helvolus]MBB2957739.1 soluble lytic murein transglycosylase-like protein [Pseudoclavibacter helvolus]